MQQLSFDGRTRLEVMVDLAIKRLQHYAQFDERGYYLAFSGGKDSQCIYHLAKEAGVKFDAHYNQTGIDPPELIYNMRKHYPDGLWSLMRSPCGNSSERTACLRYAPPGIAAFT